MSSGSGGGCGGTGVFSESSVELIELFVSQDGVLITVGLLHVLQSNCLLDVQSEDIANIRAKKTNRKVFFTILLGLGQQWQYWFSGSSAEKHSNHHGGGRYLHCGLLHSDSYRLVGAGLRK